jgi:hypothetical protein
MWKRGATRAMTMRGKPRGRAGLAIGVAALLAASCGAQSATSERSAGKRPGQARPRPASREPAPARLLRGWLDSLNSGDLARITLFHRRHIAPANREGASPEQAARRDVDLRDSTGGFDLHRIVASSATEVRATLRERGGLGWAEARFVVEPAKPEVLAETWLRAVPTPAELRPATSTAC